MTGAHKEFRIEREMFSSISTQAGEPEEEEGQK